MTTNFPSGVDAFTNPTSNDTLDNPPHDQQHADINDAMEAVQTSLLDGSPLKIDDANNRVGIGTTSPDTKLHVQIGTSAAPSSVPTSHMIIADSGEATDSGMAVYSSTTGNGYIRFGDSDSAAQGGFRYEHSADKMYFRTGGADRGAIDSSGNVGINDTTPSYKLDVNGDINSTGKFYQNGGVYGGIVAIGHDGQYSAVATTGSTVVSTGISVTMTPKSSSSKFLIFNSIPCWCGTDSNGYSSVAFYLRRNGSNILTENGFMYDGNSGTQHVGKWCHTFLDSPNTTSAVTYELFFSNHPYSNGQAQISVSTGAGYTPSQMWIWELAQ